ncbi:PREDICTED: SOSS complex subunit C isoform X1 [Dipodomys ordii]|uniref:SOSS complex subunit C n=1 Tax=Dipodomys ordii TaxID=10020 RepID=A0A1S3FS32_DIPOR|nr:PREDICTED: SOSS complex subunit C isoform X1 [Dipodomys ordii]XP_012878662.1 PREDICTED: SOSS complex subunit C isoform X1 [Dipodomys ordii]
MAANPSGQGFQNKNRVAILAELDKEKRKLLMQNQSSTNHPGASIALSRPALNKDYRDHAEQQHIAAQQKAALQSEENICDENDCNVQCRSYPHSVLCQQTFRILVDLRIVCFFKRKECISERKKQGAR